MREEVAIVPMQPSFVREALRAMLLSRLPGVGAAQFRTLFEHTSSPAEAWRVWKNRSFGQPRYPLKSPVRKGIKAGLAFIRAGGGGMAWFNGPGYPAQLGRLSEPPPILFWRGQLPMQKMAAVVGARNASAEALANVTEVVARLSAHGFGVISGGALGIDAAAHSSALQQGFQTIAVLGCGVDVVYPRSHGPLFAQIVAAGGALVSELMPGTPPQRSFFPTRNRIVAAWADLLVIVQASAKSGTLITARWAERSGVPVLVCTPAEGPAWEGNRRLLAAGAGLWSSAAVDQCVERRW